MLRETEDKARTAFKSAMDRMRGAGYNPTQEQMEVLWMYFVSGVQFGLDNAHRERPSIILPH